MAHVFVSYCHDYADFAQILWGKLRDAGLGVRMDLNVSAGDNWRAEIDSDLKSAFAVLVVMSRLPEFRRTLITSGPSRLEGRASGPTPPQAAG